MTISELEEPVVRHGKRFTDQGAIVRSFNPGHVGWYFECKMKANKTVMPSTFWLMTKNDTGRSWKGETVKRVLFLVSIVALASTSKAEYKEAVDPQGVVKTIHAVFGTNAHPKTKDVDANRLGPASFDR